MDRPMESVEALARSMRFGDASDLARVQGDLGRAYELALEGRDLARAQGIAEAIAALEGDRDALVRRARAAAVRRAEPASEGIVLEAIGALDEAAALYEQGNAWARAAALHRRRGDVARAGRALERHVRAEPGDDVARIRLGELLLETGRAEAALRAIQGVDDAAAKALRMRAESAMGLRESDPSQEPVRAATDEKLLFGRYEVVREVASTASSRVLEALDRLSPDRARVALKIFTGAQQVGAGRDALARFRREMDVLEHVEAPTVLRARAFIAEGPTIVLPWMGGGSAADLRARGPLVPSRAAEITGRVLEALDAAHRRGVIHRDVKPANVLLDEIGGAYLADFGVAHLGDASATATAGLLGTLKYMAPEQKMGAPATAKSDVYAAAVVLAELLGVSTEPPRFDALPVEGAAWFRALLSDDPSGRPDAATARAHLAAIRWPAAIESAPDDEVRQSLPPASRRFVVDEGGAHDAVLVRGEIVVAEDDPRAPLAHALAASTDPRLPFVFGADPARGLRIERVEGAAVTSLTPDERADVAAALTTLHRAARVHGDVARSMRRTPRGVVLAFPDRIPEGTTAGDDLAALARCGGP